MELIVIKIISWIITILAIILPTAWLSQLLIKRELQKGKLNELLAFLSTWEKSLTEALNPVEKFVEYRIGYHGVNKVDNFERELDLYKNSIKTLKKLKEEIEPRFYQVASSNEQNRTIAEKKLQEFIVLTDNALETFKDAIDNSQTHNPSFWDEKREELTPKVQAYISGVKKDFKFYICRICF